MTSSLRSRWLWAALLVGLAVRLPGVFWGWNFPTGWRGHHVDEYTHMVNAQALINPALVTWMPPYPKGMAAHVGVPMMALRMATGKTFAPLPGPRAIFVAGRMVSVAYGVATILLVFLLARKLFSDPRVADAAAWLVALGGLHVTQSHFFLSDVSSICWLLIGLYFLYRELESEGADAAFLHLAAASIGVAFGLKLTVAGMASLAIVAVRYAPRIRRMIYAGVFFTLGVVAVNFGTYSPYDFFKTLTRGIDGGLPRRIDRVMSAVMYAIELPGVIGFPVLALAIAGSFALAARLTRSRGTERFWRVMLIVVLPAAATLWPILFKLDHFPRHLLGLFPWIAMAAAWALVRVRDRAGAGAVVAVFLYLSVFVYDGERYFWNEPRNDAVRWVMQHVPPGSRISWPEQPGGPSIPGYQFVKFPAERIEEAPAAVLIDMHFANHFLSGVGWRESYPGNIRDIFAAENQRQVDQMQALFRGTSEYKEQARFAEHYFMPEFRLADGLLGNRSRNYITEVVVFARPTGR